MTQLSGLGYVELLGPLVEGLGHQEMSFEAMTEAMGVGDVVVATAFFRKAARPRITAARRLEGLRGLSHTGRAKVFLLVL